MNKFQSAFLVSLTGLAVLFLITGCGSLPIKPSGFLGDYTDLKRTDDGRGTLLYVKHNNVLSGYNKVMLDPIEIWFDPGTEYYGINPDELNILTDYFYDAIVQALEAERDQTGLKPKQGYPVVNQPGPGVLRVRIAITGLTPELPKRGIGSHSSFTYVQMKLNNSAARKISGFKTSLEAELLDAQTHERLIAIVDQRASDTSALPPGPPTWEYAKSALEYWANRLRQAMDDAKEKDET